VIFWGAWEQLVEEGKRGGVREDMAREHERGAKRGQGGVLMNGKRGTYMTCSDQTTARISFVMPKETGAEGEK
jgi:hypothetical protein